MTAVIDGLTSPTLKHLRERWWNADFTEFLAETLRPRPGNRILDVGCGEGLGQISIGRLHISQMRLVGIDLVLSKVVAARQTTAAHNQRAAYAAADAARLPFRDGAFDSLYCVAVLQHIGDVATVAAEFARVTRPGGRVVAVEPDNSARYAFSSTVAGTNAFALANRFFAALAESRGEEADSAVGPKLPGLFEQHGIQPIDVRLFPVSHARLTAPPESVWVDRRQIVERAREGASAAVRAVGAEYLAALQEYQQAATQAGAAFVEIQNTMLFATVGQRSD